MLCPFCNKTCKNKNSLAQHKIRCNLNDNRIKINMKGKNNPMYGKKGSNQFTTGTATSVSKETKLKISKKLKGVLWSAERKENHSLTMCEAVKNNPESYTKNNVCGRVKHIKYNDIILKGTWELRTAKWLDSQNIKWEYEESYFDYFWNKRVRRYYPDFYLPEFDTYVEVKGYKTDRDDFKWKSVTKPLLIFDKNVLTSLESHDIMYFYNKSIYNTRL